ncbi:BMP family lipoprotein [Capillibacterium thermochitinicola]|uniref:BMP family ABC transporter substrate-binding protein n=1 Tax=Capillibacterium thermochitinicola TaxID=2699427 RepID=A0A8J6I0Z4_9FIRM|nr:BMP family ABC transporter substrate-binding protein [Capillibacterium thermochitinicola]MBA2132983.1 BMP family ABC transporter substrate-binding protein [Capillibacterium thermochitinicola]
MFKKVLIALVILVVAVLVVVNVGQRTGVLKMGRMKVGMVTDAGTIDDKSFNQGTWEGVVQAGEELGLETKYLKPAGTTEADYLTEIGNLYDAGFKFMVCPGFKFETAIYQAQERYPDAKFVLIDGNPHAGDFVPVVKENTVSIFFAEHESGFVAGVATALQLQEGELGFIGGMEIPAVQKFNWGFQQGVKYANANLGTNMVIRPENVIYQGSFDNVAAGQQLAAQMYDRGVKAIFAAAGGVGIGVINEAKARARAGQEVWVVGVDVDQYYEGIYEGNKSVILTSAMKQIKKATYDMIKAETEGKFPGGQILVFDAKNDGIGIPEKNPNLRSDVESKVAEVYAKLKSGEIVVSDMRGDLIR